MKRLPRKNQDQDRGKTQDNFPRDVPYKTKAKYVALLTTRSLKKAELPAIDTD
jgi:hypothetical protein